LIDNSNKSSSATKDTQCDFSTDPITN